ncbi:MAG: PrsW family glutamic-type intramembrane protease [Patescibacteria group bacterium]
MVLGFVFAENLLYLVSGQFSLGTWIWRSFFTLIAHVFTALICAHFWWRALSYPLFSARYIGTFLIGFLLAGGLHTLYNLLLAGGNIIGLLIYVVVGYVLVVVRKN